MTKEPLNIQKILEEFDEEWQRHLCPAPPVGDRRWLEQAEEGRERVKSFLTQKLREVMESVNPGRIRFEASPKITISDGYNKAIADIDRNITNFFKEL